MALEILKRDFVGAVVGPSCGCETAEGDQQWDYGLLVWRRLVRQKRRKITEGRNWKMTRYGAVAVCIESSAGIRSALSARCKVTVTLNTDLAYTTALCSITRSRSIDALTARCWLLDVLTVEIQDILPVVHTVLHLIHPIYFQFHHLPFCEISP
jgi:hypothetical protein